MAGQYFPVETTPPAFEDTTTGDATTSQHGFLPKLDGDATHVLLGDGSFGAVPGGGGGGGGTWAFNETPSGTVNGSNAVFTIAHTPTGLLLFKNGLLQRAGSGNDYTISGATVTFETGNVPATGDILLATYLY